MAKEDFAEHAGLFTKPFVIEFDDEGELYAGSDLPRGKEQGGRVWPRPEADELSQFAQARAAIRYAKSAGKEVTLFVFVHGWKHGANYQASSHSRSNLVSFERFLTELQNSQWAQSEPDRVFVGVYIAWRGSPWNNLRHLSKYNPVRIANELALNVTLWNRLATADRVGRTSATYALLTLAAEAKRGDIGPAGPARDDRVIIVGHSMGARIVEHAIAQAFVGSLAFRAPGLAQSVSSVDDAYGAAAKQEQDASRFLEQYARSADLLAQDGETIAARLEELKRKKEITADGIQKIDIEATRLAASGDEEAAEAVRSTAAVETESGIDVPLPAVASDWASPRQEHLFHRQQLVMELARIESEVGLLEERGRSTAEARDLVERATQAMVQWRQAARHHRDELHGYRLTARQHLEARPADLVLLVNPATDSIFTRQLRDALSDPWLQHAFKDSALARDPWIVQISSKSDYATRALYQVGSLPSFLTRSYRQDQFYDFGRPPPHSRRFRTHTLVDLPDSTGSEASVPSESGGEVPTEVLRDLLTRNLMPIGSDRALNEAHEKRVIFTANRNFALQRLPTDQPDSTCPIWVVRTNRNRDLIKDHNHIFHENFYAITAAFLRITDPTPDALPPLDPSRLAANAPAQP